jgi:phage-related protein
MYWINFEGSFEMKADTITEIKDWIRENEVPAAFSWARLEATGETESVCKRWYIRKGSHEELQGLDHISRFEWVFNDIAKSENTSR